MSMVDISKGFRQYSPESLRDYTYRGLITCGPYDMSDFLEHIFQGMISEAEAERIALAAGERAYDEGYADGVYIERDMVRGED